MVDCFQKRLHTYAIRTRTWAGPQLGEGAVVETDVVPIPTPRLRLPEPTEQTNQAGRFEAGDIILDRISATFTAVQLGDFGDVTQPANVEVYWVIDGTEEYDVISTEIRYLEWRVHLRRKRPR